MVVEGKVCDAVVEAFGGVCTLGAQVVELVVVLWMRRGGASSKARKRKRRESRR